MFTYTRTRLTCLCALEVFVMQCYPIFSNDNFLQLEQLSPLGLPILFDNLPTPTATNCPYHPATVDLPNPLPDSIINNVTLGLQMLKQNVLNSQTLVSWILYYFMIINFRYCYSTN